MKNTEAEKDEVVEKIVRKIGTGLITASLYFVHPGLCLIVASVWVIYCFDWCEAEYHGSYWKSSHFFVGVTQLLLVLVGGYLIHPAAMLLLVGVLLFTSGVKPKKGVE